MVLLNTSFFFTPTVATNVRAALRDKWLKACGSCGCGEPMCLQMPPEQGVERLAIQTPFQSQEDAERFLREVLGPLAGELARHFGPEAFTAFSTIMQIVTL